VRGRAAVAKRYAKALFELAKEQGRTEPVGRELGEVVEVFETNPGLGEALSRPWSAAASRRQLVAAVTAGLEASKLMQDFVALLAARGRTGVLREIAVAYAELVDAALGRARARVRTAAPLTPADRATLTAGLERVLGGRRVVLDEVLDRTLLGGFVAEVGSTVLDGSLDGQLARIRERLAAG
jgi:F-type H+-transporting ATPase subunit delta